MKRLMQILVTLGLEFGTHKIPVGEALVRIDLAASLYLLGAEARLTVLAREYKIRIWWVLART